MDMTGIVLMVLGASFLIVRVMQYQLSNPFADDDAQMKKLPQMILLLLASETFMMFGIYYTMYAMPTVTSSTAIIANVPLYCTGGSLLTSCGTTTEVQNFTSTQRIIPIGASNQPINLWIVGFIYTFIIALMLLADALAIMKEGAQNSLDEG